MLKSNNYNSVAEDLLAFSTPLSVKDLTSTTLPLESITNVSTCPPSFNETQTTNKDGAISIVDVAITATTESELAEKMNSLSVQQLAAGFLQSYAPPIGEAKGQLKDLIQKQNKIYIDLSSEKFKLDNAELARLHEMMNNVKTYREKLLKIKKQMQSIYQRTKVLKKRALNIHAYKEKELHRKLQKQQQEESLIGKQQQEKE